MQRVAINGFGRIGRNVLRAWFENPKDFHYLMLSAHSDSANPTDLRNRNVLVRARLLFQ